MSADLPYHALFEASPQAMWVEDPAAGVLLAVNEAALRLYGYTREAFLGLAPAALLEGAAAAAGGGRALQIELARVPLAFDRRQVALVIATDASPRLVADEELRRAQALWRAAGRVARIGGWALDVEQQRFEWSEETRLLFEAEPGFAPSLDEAILLCAPGWRDRVRLLLDELLRAGRPFREEVEVVSRRGRRFWVRISAEPVSDPDGRVRAVEGAVQNITDERNARAWSEARLRHFLDAMPAPIWSAQPDGRLDYANRVLYDYVGLTPESFHPSRWPELVHPDDRARAVAVSDAAYRAGRPYACELRLRGRDGGYRWHLDAGTPLRDEQGTILKYYGTVTDIHDIKVAEEALRDREARLRTIIEQEPECVKVVSAEGLLLEMNPAGLRMLRAPSLEPLLGRPTEDLVHPDDRDLYRDLHRRALGGESGQAIYRVIDFQGGERWMESNAALLKGPEGQPDTVLSVTRDITERRRTEAALLSALKRNDMILASSGEGIQGFEADGRLAFINDAALRMLGYEEAELRGRQLHVLLHHHRANGEPYPTADCPIHQTLRDGRTRAVENEVFFRKDDSSFPVEYTVSAILEGGRVTGAVLNFRNVAKKRRYAELRDLEARVLEMVSAGVALPAVLTEITLTADRLLPQACSSVLLLDEQGRLRHGAGPHLPETYNHAVDGLEIGPRAGSCGTAAWRREQVIVEDVLRDPLWADYRDLAAQAGLRACWSNPILNAQGQVLATFAVYYAEPRTPDAADQELIARISQYVRTAIERHRTTEALRLSEERLRALAENVQEVFWISNPEKTRMLYVSPAYEKIWGRTCDELYADASKWIAAIHPEDRARVLAASARQVEGEYAEEYRVVRQDGAIRWISDRGFPVYAADGSVRQLVGSARDITPRKLAELALRERLKELRCLYRVTWLIAGQQRPVGAICQEIAELLPEALLHEASAVARIELGNASYGSAGWQAPLATFGLPIGRGGDGVGRIEIGYTATFEPQPGGHGPFLKEEVEMVQTIAVHLGDMLNQRLLAQRLTESERLNAIGQLTGGVAHDFNNLLTVILGNAEALAEKLTWDRDLRQLAEMTAKAAERGAELTNRLLAFARRQPLDPKVQDINLQVAQMEGLLRRTLGEHVEIRMVCAPGLWRAMVDPGQLESAVLNLCINARDAMPDGGRLTIETANVVLDQDYAARQGEVEPGPYVLLAVSDSGVGMDGATLERAVEPFFTTKEVGKGSGLGLSMVYGFAKQSKGHIRIYSEPGHGTTVKLYLPRAADEAPADLAKEIAAPPEKGSERVLLVEDDDLVRTHVCDHLLGLGYEVVAVANGPQALEVLLRGEHYDLLFTDVVMPGGMSGLQLAEEGRRLRPDLPVLFTSGYTENAINHQGRLEPGVQLLQKPYRRQELAAKVRQALDQQAARAT